MKRVLPIMKSRREFMRTIAVAAAATASAVGVACGPPFGKVSAGNVSTLAVGDVNIVPGASAAIARDAQGVYAMTLICTHESCDISVQGTVSSSGITCDCHGSRFDVNGNVIIGPASSPLQHYAVTVDAQGNLTVDGDTPVSASTRLAI